MTVHIEGDVIFVLRPLGVESQVFGDLCREVIRRGAVLVGVPSAEGPACLGRSLGLGGRIAIRHLPAVGSGTVTVRVECDRVLDPFDHSMCGS